MNEDPVDRFLRTIPVSTHFWRVGYTLVDKLRLVDGKEHKESGYDLIVDGTPEEILAWVRSKGGEIQYFVISPCPRIVLTPREP